MTDLIELERRMRDDAMALRDAWIPKPEVVFVKSIVEAYPGVAAVHAIPRREQKQAADGRAPLIVATARELEAELDAVLDELAAEIEGMTWAHRPARVGNGPVSSTVGAEGASDDGA